MKPSAPVTRIRNDLFIQATIGFTVRSWRRNANGFHHVAVILRDLMHLWGKSPKTCAEALRHLRGVARTIPTPLTRSAKASTLTSVHALGTPVAEIAVLQVNPLYVEGVPIN